MSLFTLLERIRREGHPTPAEWAEAIDGRLPQHQADVVILVMEAALANKAPDWEAIGKALGIHPTSARARLEASQRILPAILLEILDSRQSPTIQA